MQRANLINKETDLINAEKHIRLLWNWNMKKHSDLAYKFRKHNFTRCFMRKQWTISKHGVLQLAKKKSCQSNFHIISQTCRCTEKIFHIPLRNTASQELTYSDVVRFKFFFISEWSTLSAILTNHLTIQ